MSEAKKRKVHTPEFKAKVGLEALRGVKTINEIGMEYGVHPVQVGQWKKAIQEQASTLFDGKWGPKPVTDHQEPDRLYSEIGRLKVELDWLKKIRDVPAMTRQGWILQGDEVPVVRQCALLEISRATFYAAQLPHRVDEIDLLLCRLIDEEYTRHPFFGSRKMVVCLKTQGYIVNRKRVQRLMRAMGLVAMAPGPNTSRPHPEHKIYPYLLRGVTVVRPNQVWSTDITYIRLARGFVYLVAIIDWYSRRVLSWRISNSMEAVFCVDCLEEALRAHGKPEVFNSDQGAQFTSEAFTDVLKREGIVISMDGRGRAFDNIALEALAQRQARRCVSEGLCHGRRTDAWPDRVLRLLHWRETAPVPGSTNAGCRVSDCDRGRVDDSGQVQGNAGGIPCSAALHRGFLRRCG